MPLMVDSETGRLLIQHESPASATSASSLPSAAVHLAIGNPLSITSSTDNVTSGDAGAIMDGRAPHQLMLSRATPYFFLLALGGLLIISMILSYNRFIARFLASTQKLAPSRERTEKLGLGGGSARILGGGDLMSGWVLKRGKIPPPTVESPQDPFTDVPLSAAPQGSVPTLFPPPHLTPLIDHIPYAHTLHYAPFRRFPTYLRSSITIARLYPALCYIALVCVALVWKSDLGPTSTAKGAGRDFARTGNMAVAQIPVVIALGVKGNLVGLAMGVGYEKLQILHKLVGRSIFLCTTVHIGYFLWLWQRQGILSEKLGATSMIYGSLGYWALVMLTLSSLPVVRKLAHGLFKICHVIGIIGFLIGTALHADICVPFCIAGLVIYMISMIQTLSKTRLAHAELLTLPSSGITGIFIPSLRTGWRPGQHVRIRVPAIGLKQGWESHPFTISSAPDGEGLVLLCKRLGDWTTALYDLAAAGIVCPDGEGNQTTVSVIIDGPYGGIGNTMLPSFSSILLTAGGAGISHALSVAHDLMKKAPSGCIRARTIDLVWIVRNEETARGVLPTLLDLVNDAKAHETFCLEGQKKGKVVPQPTGLRIHIFISRCPISSPISLLANPFTDPVSPQDSEILFEDPGSAASSRPFLKRQPTESEKIVQTYLLRSASSSSTATTSSFGSIASIKRSGPISCINANPGRPNWAVLLDGLAEETIRRAMKAKVDASGICVTSCGPHGLVDGVRDAVRGMEGWKRRQVGGVEFEEEHFAF